MSVGEHMGIPRVEYCWNVCIPVEKTFLPPCIVHLVTATCLKPISENCNPNSLCSMSTDIYTFSSLPLSFWYLSICNDSLLAFLVKISHSSVSLQNNVLLARVPESCRVTSCTQERALLCLITVEIMRVEKGFVLPLRTLSAADGAAGIFSCRRCWRADRRAHMCM